MPCSGSLPSSHRRSRRLPVREDFENNTNVFHFLSNCVSPEGVAILFVKLKSFFDGLNNLLVGRKYQSSRLPCRRCLSTGGCPGGGARTAGSLARDIRTTDCMAGGARMTGCPAGGARTKGSLAGGARATGCVAMASKEDSCPASKPTQL